MRLITFTLNNSTRTGALRGNDVIDLHATDANIPSEMIALLEGGDEMMARAKEAVANGTAVAHLDDVRLESPITRPSKILAVGLNYRPHVNEVPKEVLEKRGFKEPENPVIFNKQSTSVTGPFDPMLLPPESTEMDYEAELGVVIGKTCRRVPEDKVFDVIAGYTIVNDGTIRDWQRHTPTMTMGKSCDSHCPMGPAIVTADEIGDPQNLQVSLSVNGDPRQNFNTDQMIFDIKTLVQYLSTAFTLLPGDVIVSGTSAGVGVFLDGGTFLKEGDVVRAEIENIGHIENYIEKDDGSSFIK